MTTTQQPPQVSMNINEASKACGLSPSVLRIWELRYGWPSPKRKANGYRSYSSHQVDELKRVADLVKNGTPISAVIIDGLPRWPAESVQKRVVIGLTRARLIPRPSGSNEARIQLDLLDAVEKRHTNLVKELLQRAFWSVRPVDEPLAVHIPTLAGLAELATDKAMAEDGDLRALLKERCIQLLRRYRFPEATVWLVPGTTTDHALAYLAALILNQRGHQAQVWTEAGTPNKNNFILVGDQLDPAAGKGDRRCLGRIAAIGEGDKADVGGIVGLLNTPPGQPLPSVTLSTN